jgi:hypothetical protein
MSDVKTEWRPIATAPLPRFSKRDYFDRRFACLIYDPERGVSLGVFSYAGNGTAAWSSYGIGPSRRANPTHWMPLPEGPQDA